MLHEFHITSMCLIPHHSCLSEPETVTGTGIPHVSTAADRRNSRQSRVSRRPNPSYRCSPRVIQRYILLVFYFSPSFTPLQILTLPNHRIILFDRIESLLPCPLLSLLRPLTHPQVSTFYDAQAHPPPCSTLVNIKMPKNCSSLYQNALRTK